MGSTKTNRRQVGGAVPLPSVSIRRDETGVYVGERRYTLGEISRGSGVSRPHIARVFGRKRKMSLEVAQRIAGFLGVSLDTLVGFIKS